MKSEKRVKFDCSCTNPPWDHLEALDFIEELTFYFANQSDLARLLLLLKNGLCISILDFSGVIHQKILPEHIEISKLVKETRFAYFWYFDEPNFKEISKISNIRNWNCYLSGVYQRPKQIDFLAQSSSITRLRLCDALYTREELRDYCDLIESSKTLRHIEVSREPESWDFFQNALVQNYHIQSFSGTQDPIILSFIERNQTMRKACISATLCVIWCGKYHYLGKDIMGLLARVLWDTTRFLPIWSGGIAQGRYPKRRRIRAI